jgi:hypothetical protein
VTGELPPRSYPGHSVKFLMLERLQRQAESKWAQKS